jgi:hypothetical protein
MKKNNNAGACPAPVAIDPATGDASEETTFPDTLSQKGATALARRLQAFWDVRGYHTARFWAEPVGERFAKVGTYEIYRVACNLVNGRPPRLNPHRNAA